METSVFQDSNDLGDSVERYSTSLRFISCPPADQARSKLAQRLGEAV
jgi:hypothetical protein